MVMSALDDILRLFILRYTNAHIDWLLDGEYDVMWYEDILRYYITLH